MQVYLMVIGIVVLFLFIAFLLGIRNEIVAEREFIADNRKNMGKAPNLKLSKARLAAIPRYSITHRDDNTIDDITWNDLGLDAVYERINYCKSGAGQEYLYHRLRTPKQSDDFVSEEKHIEHFSKNQKLSEKCMLILAKMGNSGKYSLYEYLDRLDELKNTSNKSHIILDVLLLVSVIGTFFYFGVFFVLSIVLLFVNIVRYFAYKGEIEPYLETFRYVIRISDCASMISKIDDEVLRQETQTLKEDAEKMASFKRGSFIIMSPTRLSSSGDPINVLLNYVCMITHLDLIKFNQMYAQLKNNKDIIDRMITTMGHIDMELSIMMYRASLNDNYCLPVFDNSSEKYNAENLYHPNMNNPVLNSIHTDRSVLLTGSNASGKSTFLKTIAISAVMAQSIHTVLGTSYNAPMYRVYSSMALRDDLVSGDSYYIVEIKSLKRILDSAKRDGNKILCLIDEVLRGTNTVERIAASTQILRFLKHDKIQCFAATHDIELTELLKEDYENYHFEGTVTGNDVKFDYTLKKGPATNRNAIKLLSMIGYDSGIVDAAQAMADNFDKTGSWK